MDAMASPSVLSEHFGNAPDGTSVERYTLTNTRGTTLRVLSWGAIVQSLEVANAAGRFDDVVLGYDTIEPYYANRGYVGAVVGRYANRIANGRFTLDGREYTLAANNGPNHLHGGLRGFDKQVWTATTEATGPRAAAEGRACEGVRFELVSPDGDEGYPGTLRVFVQYTLTEADVVVIDYGAVTDAPTIVNLTNHSYFNLAGAATCDIGGHVLELDADAFTPVVEGAIPTGERAPVEGTPFDFRVPTPIGARIDAQHPQLLLTGGYDHNVVVRGEMGTLRRAARASEPSSGRTLEVHTTEPGMQFYAGNKLDGTLVGKRGRPLRRRHGFCLETQHFPDSPNQPGFPPTVLRPGEAYRSTTEWRFGCA